MVNVYLYIDKLMIGGEGECSTDGKQRVRSIRRGKGRCLKRVKLEFEEPKYSNHMGNTERKQRVKLNNEPNQA
jgi:hypothetical protein